MKRTPIRKLIGTSWFIPMAYTTLTLLVGMTFPRIEHHLLPNVVSTMSAASAMNVCSAIASGMIALTGIVFSLTFVTGQFSATATAPVVGRGIAPARRPRSGCGHAARQAIQRAIV